MLDDFCACLRAPLVPDPRLLCLLFWRRSRYPPLDWESVGMRMERQGYVVHMCPLRKCKRAFHTLRAVKHHVNKSICHRKDRDAARAALAAQFPDPTRKGTTVSPPSVLLKEELQHATE